MYGKTHKLLMAGLIAAMVALTGCQDSSSAPMAAATQPAAQPAPPVESRVSLSPERWRADYDKYLALESRAFPDNPLATGSQGAVTTTYHSAAGRAGLEALKQGGTSVDAALTTALTQVAEGAGAVISYFGILTMAHYDAASGEIVTLNAGWNTVQNETDPMSIPGSVNMADLFAGGEPSGRTALVGGFMRGAEAAHARFGKLPWAALFEPAIFVAEQGFDLPPETAGYFKLRDSSIRRLPETRATLVKPDGTGYVAGDRFTQPAVAATLKAIAEQGAGYMYTGALGQRIVDAVQAEGGKMTLKDLADYQPVWSPPRQSAHGEYVVNMLGEPSLGSVNAIEALNLVEAGNVPALGHWSESGEAFRHMSNISMMFYLSFLTPDIIAQIYPGLDLSPQARLTRESAQALWPSVKNGVIPAQWAARPSHSDTVVAVDQWGNMTAITHSINCVIWGSTAIVVDGVSIGDAAAFQQAAIAAAGPGAKLPDPTEVGIVTRGGKPELAFASMAVGLHQQTLQSLVNYMDFGMDVKQAVDAPALFLPMPNAENPPKNTMRVMKGSFPAEVIEASGIPVEEIPAEQRRYAQGLWIGISRDPATGVLKAASPPYATGMAFAY